MNEAALSEQLRALREPAPSNGFEERLQQALWREAGELRVERARDAEPALHDVRSLRRVRRWAGRFGLGMIIACGATAAAAAAGGIWAAVTYSGRSSSDPAAQRAAPEREGADAKRVSAPQVSAEAPGAGQPSSAAEPTATTPPSIGSSDAPASAPLSPARDKPRSSASPPPAPRERSTPSEPSALVPFDLPARAGAERAAGAQGTAADRPSRLERLQLPEPRAAAGNAQGRALPALPARADRRARSDNSASERGAAPPGLEIARERASEKAERGLERAREARERK
jgi:hypothetical protein